MFTATKVQVASYLFGVCLFSISFLVFLNSSISFVVTDLLKQDHGVGNAVGTLGFADELVALIACPFWGVLSDRIGVRPVGRRSIYSLETDPIPRSVFWATLSLESRCFCSFKRRMCFHSYCLPGYFSALVEQLARPWSQLYFHP